MHKINNSEDGEGPNRQATTSTLNREAFAAALLHALRHFPKLETLEASPLPSSRIVVSRLHRDDRPQTPVQALRSLIREQCEPWGGAPKTAILHRVLVLTYLEPMRTQQEAAEALNMSWSTYRRRLCEARELLVNQLWEAECLLASSAAHELVVRQTPATARFRSRRYWLVAPVAATALLAAGLLFWRLGPWSPASSTDLAASIAVLPFQNLSTDKNNSYFVTGVEDEILTRLAAIDSLKVISGTSTANLPSRPADVRAIARQLGVATVLEGSVQRVGQKVHINVQLIDADTQSHIWAHSYDRTLVDVFAVEREVAGRVATALSAELLPNDRPRSSRIRTRDPQAGALFLKTNHYAR